MHKPVRLAVVGIDHPHGFAWRETLRAIAPDILIEAVVPGFQGSLTSLEESLAEIPRYATVSDLLASGIEFDGAFVALSNRDAPPAIESLAKAGKHIIAEKPIAAHASDFREGLGAIRTAGVAFQNGYVWRYDPGVERLRRMVADGQFGRLISIEMTMVTSDIRRRGRDHYLFDPSVSGSGFFNWLGCHWLDLLMDVVRKPIIAVTSRIGVFGSTPVDVEDGGAVILELEAGGLATLVGGYWIPRWAGESQWTVRGTERWVHWDPSRPGTGGILEIHGPRPQWDAMDEVITLPSDEAKGYAGSRGIAAVRDWIDVIRGVRPSTRNTPESTLAVLEVLDAIHESSREGRRVECRIASS